MSRTAAEVYNDAAAAGARPDPVLTVSEWADQHRVLSSKSSAEPGPWRTSRTPYLREIMDCLSVTSPITRVVVQAGAQTGKTECGNNWIGYIVRHVPGPMLCVQPTLDLAKRFSAQRIDPLFEEDAIARFIKGRGKARDKKNQRLTKEFMGGLLIIAGANSAPSLRSMPVRYLFLDEVDAYPAAVGKEGDPVDLAEKRTATFRIKRKVLMTSTPGITGQSKIESAYQASDKRQYFVPCPACGEFQVLKFGNLRWPKGRPDKVVYVCEHCAVELKDYNKAQMLPRGEWRATAEGDGQTAGFHLSALYSPVGWYSWEQAAADWEKAQGSAEKLQVFVNTVLAETWHQVGEAPDWKRLYDMAEPYHLGTVPEGVLFLTAGADVQKDRIEIYVYGWGRNKESWLVDIKILDGDTARPEVWQELTKALEASYPHPSGCDMYIARAAVDSNFSTADVYAWGRKQHGGRVLVIRGMENGAVAIGHPFPADVSQTGKHLRRSVKVWPVATSMLKHELYGWLRLDRPTREDLAKGAAHPPGFCHFAQVGEEFFRQLTAEQLVTKLVNGYRKTRWEKTRDRNEALDCRVYARAGAAHFGIDRFQERHWKALEVALGKQTVETSPPLPSPAPPAPRPDAGNAQPATAPSGIPTAPPPSAAVSPASTPPTGQGVARPAPSRRVVRSRWI